MMQAPEASRRQAPALLLKVGRAFRPGGHTRVGALVRRKVREIRISAEIGAVPAEEHPRITAGDADQLQVIERHAGGAGQGATSAGNWRVVAGRIEQRAVLPALQRRRHREICELI